MSHKEHHIINWAIARNLVGPTGQATPEGQLQKLREEVNEVADEIASRDRDKLALELGDCYVVLCLMANLWNLSMDECIDAAWDKIKDRKGMMLQGKFVKQDNLDSLSRAGFQFYQGKATAVVDTAEWRDAAISSANANGLSPVSHWMSERKQWEVLVS